MLDAFIGAAGLYRMGDSASFFVNGRYFDVPVAGSLLRAIDAIPVDLDNPGFGSLGAGIDHLRAGRSVVIMPEGRLTSRGERGDKGIGPLQPGVAVLARRVGVPVVPVAIVGTDLVLPPGRRTPAVRAGRRQRVVVRYGQPMEITGRPRDGMTELADRLSALVATAEADLAATS